MTVSSNLREKVQKWNQEPDLAINQTKSFQKIPLKLLSAINQDFQEWIQKTALKEKLACLRIIILLFKVLEKTSRSIIFRNVSERFLSLDKK